MKVKILVTHIWYDHIEVAVLNKLKNGLMK